MIVELGHFALILALGVGYLVFGEVPSWVVIFGALIVVAAGILIIWRERQLGLERARQRQSMTP